ncbi:unnamed protein product [Pedinophyceae sp. YPF-701]|nr:unnamed protein product [Pedinophyceae sp. YPF-701]
MQAGRGETRSALSGRLSVLLIAIVAVQVLGNLGVLVLEHHALPSSKRGAFTDHVKDVMSTLLPGSAPVRPLPATPRGTHSAPDVYSVVVPTYNERENIPLIVWMLVDVFRDRPERLEVVVVDDNSPDGTRDVVRKLQREYGSDVVKLRERPGKLGLGTAYKDGLTVVTGSWVVLMDADLSHDPRDIVRFVERQRETGSDIVVGTRYAAGVYGWDVVRKITSLGANILASTLLWPGVTDLTGAFRLYRADVLRLLMEETKSEGYAFQMETIVRAKAYGFKVVEVPIVFVDRLYGESKLGGAEVVAYLKGLVRLVFTL